MTPAARLVHDMRMARVRDGVRRALKSFVDEKNGETDIDTAIRNAEAAIARKRAAEPKEGQRP